MKIFITGIVGMIGFHAARHLKSLGHEVQGIDDFNGYYSPKLKEARENILTEEGITVFHKRLQNLHGCDSTMEWYDGDNVSYADVVLHLAAYANPRHALKDPFEYIDTNISGTDTLIHAVENTKNWTKRPSDIPVVYASSSTVMEGQPLPYREDDRFVGHHSNPYAWSKYVNECQFKHSNLKRSAGLRFFTVYGPWGRPDMALYKFTDQIVNGEKTTLYNNGSMRRDFTYVQDIVDGIELVINKIVNDTEEEYHEIYNLGYGESVHLEKFVKEIEKNLGINADIEYAPKHPADAVKTWADISKMKSIGYNPKVPVEIGVQKFVEWYKKIL